MKKILFVVSLFLSFTAFAAEQDSVKVEKKKKEPTSEELAIKAAKQAKRNEVEKKYQKFSKDRFAFDFFGSNWIYKSSDPRMNGLKTKWYSRGVNIYFSWDFRIKHSRFSFAPGIGYSCSNIYSRHGLVEDDTSVVGSYFKPLDNPDDYKVNKICLQYLDIPVEFRIKTNPDKFDNCWKFAFGFKAGVRVDAHTKQTTKINGVTKVVVERRFPDFNQFRFGPMIRIGYASFNITAYYGVLSVFKKDRGPSANEFTVGISFNGL
jgi:hypothetical protein